MSRAAFYNAITTAGIPDVTEDTVFHNYSSEERPSSTGPFIILRWSDQDRPQWQDVKSFERLTLWVHYPRELSVDFTRLIKILDEIDSVLIDLRDKVGEDGYILSFVQLGARSGDFVDEGFGTITKYASYEVFSRQS